MPRRKKIVQDPEAPAQKRKTRIPTERIKKLLNLDTKFKTEVKNIMQEYDVSLGYIRGLLRHPMK
jgi:hypothetical protein